MGSHQLLMFCGLEKAGELLGLIATELLSITLTVAGTWTLHYSEVPLMFWIANVGYGIT